ncbi:excalibur calcium-binding domain-containing protein [Methylotuvimicrobium sp. KM2]|uniref:excalibur calcium-binding domain-containing protein n=1 Tax=Methylotuvimicrobium sp. KM2 TaxID=3133976 RepID=UPI003101484C
MTTSKGTLVRWLDDKGYGFIKQVNGEPDIFIHISALKGMSRKPVIGDVIHYRVGFDKSGKTCTTNARIKGVSQALNLAAFEGRKIFKPSSARVKPHRAKANFSMPKSALTHSQFLLPLGLLPLPTKRLQSVMASQCRQNLFQLSNQPEKQTQRFQCEGKVYCSQMTLYEEAVFYLRNCPNTKLDGDGDGIPCERQFNR